MQRCLAFIDQVLTLRIAMRPSPAPALSADDIRSKLLYVRQWPDFSAERDLSRIGDLARICALLSRKPTVGFLVHRALDMPSYEVEPLVLHLIDTGAVAIFQTGTEPLAATSSTPSATNDPNIAASPAPEDGQRQRAARTFLQRLWGKLLPR